MSPTIDIPTTCPRCLRTTRRGVAPAHRCASPGLMDVGAGAQQVVGLLSQMGTRPYFVGGCVRDALVGAPSADIDIEVHGNVDLDELERVLTDAGCRVDSVGRSFGVLKVLAQDEHIDVSVPRRDVKAGNGHRAFEISIDPLLDELTATARRDFTINAMMWDPRSEEIVDAHGGLIDLEAGILRHVGAAFAEDPLRVLRAMQFVGRFELSLDSDTNELARSLADDYRHLPKERVWSEWAKLFTQARHPGRGLALLDSTEWSAHYPELTAIGGVQQEPKWHPEGTVDVHTRLAADAAAAIADRDALADEERLVLVAATITHDFGKATHTQIHDSGRVTSFGHAEAGVAPAMTFLESIGCPARIADQVAPLVREHMCATTSEGPTSAAVRRLARRLGDVPIEMWARVVEADNMGRAAASSPGPAAEWVRLAREMSVHERAVQPVINGRDLITAGLQPGPGFGPILAAAIGAQDAGLITDRASGLRWLETELASIRSAADGSP